MNVAIERVASAEQELVLIRCREVTDEVREIETFVRSRTGSLSGVSDAQRYTVAIADVFYIESVDGKTFLYTADRVFETAYRLYQLEDLLKEKHFLRIAKPMLVNLMKIQSIRPALGGRFTATLYSGEQILIARSYVKALKSALKEGAVHGA